MLLLVVLLSFLTWNTLINPGYYSMHDYQHIARLFEMDKSLSALQFPVRWVSGLGFGYGYPLFNFYPPLIYYVGELIHKFGFSFIDSVKGIWLLALAFSGVSMYLLAKELFGKVGGLTAAVFYMYAPYHAVDAYVRGALAELASFVWLPLILLAVMKKKSVLAGVFLAALMITHNLIFLPFFGYFAVWAWFYNKKSLIISPIIAFGLTAFFWLPSLAEKQFTLVDQLLIKNLASYQIHFLCPFQLWNSPWGYGGSAQGCIDGMTFMIGKIYILAIVLAAVFYLKNRSKAVLASLFLLVFSYFMTLNISRFIWDKIPQLWYLQFPWRFLEFGVLFASLLAGSIKNKLVSLILIVLVISVNYKYFKPQQLYLDATDSQLTSEQEVKWNVSSTSFEYMPKGVATTINQLGVVWPDINIYQIRNSKYEIRNGTVKENYWLPDKFEVEGNFGENAMFQPQISNFPGWKMYIDHQEVFIGDDNKYKLMTISVPSGNHVVSGIFTNTPVRQIGNIVSLAFILGIVGYFVYGLRRSKT